jgi:hypothetical protein
LLPIPHRKAPAIARLAGPPWSAPCFMALSPLPLFPTPQFLLSCPCFSAQQPHWPPCWVQICQ